MEAKLNLARSCQSLAQNFSAFQQSLIKQYGKAVFNSWFKELNIIEETKHQLCFGAKSRFIKEWIQTNYSEEFAKIIKLYKPELIDLEIIVKKSSADAVEEKDVKIDLSEDFSSKKSNDNYNNLSSNLDARMTFDNFIVEDENRLAYTGIKSLLGDDELLKNIDSIYLYSSVGLGKTHLLTAFAHQLKAQEKDYMFLSAERFTYHYSKSIKNRELINFKEKFESVEYFLLDDIHFLQGKVATQQEIVNIVDFLASHNKKIVMAGDRKINAYDNLNGKLKSLLSSGIVVSLAKPSENLRRKIIRLKLQQNNHHLDDKIVNFVAAQQFSNVRELEGAINKIMIHQNILGEKVTLDNLAEIIDDFLVKENYTNLSSDYIVKQISKALQVSLSEMKSKVRKKEVVFARNVAVYLIKKYTDHSLIEIGKIFNRDHATILHSNKKIIIDCKKDLTLKFEIEKIEEMFHNAS